MALVEVSQPPADPDDRRSLISSWRLRRGSFDYAKGPFAIRGNSK